MCAASVLYREQLEHQPTRQMLMEVHRQLGLLVLLALVGRLITRVKMGLANHSRYSSSLLRIAAILAHAAMYGAMAGIAVLGWALTNAHAVHLRLLQIVPLPSIVGADSDLADSLNDWHIAAAWLLLGLVVLHVSAALWHHFRLRDSVLIAMLPGNRRRVTASAPPFDAAHTTSSGAYDTNA
jgi:cytochrome b561